MSVSQISSTPQETPEQIHISLHELKERMIDKKSNMTEADFKAASLAIYKRMAHFTKEQLAKLKSLVQNDKTISDGVSSKQISVVAGFVVS